MSIYAITGKPRNGKTYFLARLIPRFLSEYIEEENYSKIHKEDRFPLTDSFPVGCLYPNFKINLGKGALKKYPDRIVGNLHNEDDLKNPTKLIFYWSNITDWSLMKRRGRILCDEGQRYFNARQWAYLSPETEIKLQQHGKEDLDVWLTTQHVSRIDLSLRLLLHFIGICKVTFGNPDNRKTWLPKRFQITWHYLEDIERWEKQREIINPHTGQPYPLSLEPVESEVFWLRKKYACLYDTRQKVGRSDLVPLQHREVYCENDYCPQHGRLSASGKPKVSHI